MSVNISKIQQLNQMFPSKETSPNGAPSSNGVRFKDTFKDALEKMNLSHSEETLSNGSIPSEIKFSNHAVERMILRGIRFNKDDLSKLEDAIQKAQSKGSKDSLILMNDTALIVSVKNKTIVTVMDKEALKNNVFTNIDSTIVV